MIASTGNHDFNVSGSIDNFLDGLKGDAANGLTSGDVTAGDEQLWSYNPWSTGKARDSVGVAEYDSRHGSLPNVSRQNRQGELT